MKEQMINVEVAYARPEKQMIIPVRISEGATLMDAVVASGITGHFPQINLSEDKMGLFGKAVKDPATQVLVDGDRVEIYRPLLIDPKQARVNRAKKG